MKLPIFDLERHLIGASDALSALRESIRRIAPSPAPVLILGPRGAGKELVAYALHALSGRPGSLVAFNVCAIADAMFEDAMFGHVRGAFTGATSDAQGYLAEADRGSAFFDEMSGLSQPNQRKLLRALETRAFRPVGARADRCSDFRLLSATNENVNALVRSGAFRADLLDRLGVFVIHVPPLRDRLEDVPMLARHFLELADPNRRLELSSSGLHALTTHDWPGNVRQLRHAIECLALTATWPVIRREDVQAMLLPPGADTDDRFERAQFERRRLMSVMNDMDWNVERAATYLNVHPATIYRRLQRLGLVPRLHRGRDGRAEESGPALA